MKSMVIYASLAPVHIRAQVNWDILAQWQVSVELQLRRSNGTNTGHDILDTTSRGAATSLDWCSDWIKISFLSVVTTSLFSPPERLLFGQTSIIGIPPALSPSPASIDTCHTQHRRPRLSST